MPWPPVSRPRGPSPASASTLLGRLGHLDGCAAQSRRGQLRDDHLQRRQHRSRVAESVRRLLRHRPLDHRLERRHRRNPGSRLRQRRNRLREVRPHVPLVRVGDERTPPGEKLEQQHAGRIDIGPRIRRRGLHLLRGHVRDRAEHGPDARHRVRHRARAGSFEELRHAEVQQPHVIVLVRQRLQEHVGGFQIAVDDSLAVSEGHPAQRLARDVQRPPQRQRSFLDEVVQRPALQELHHQIRHAAVDAGIRHRDDIGVGQRRQRPRLPREPLAPLRAGGRVRVQHLDRHEPVRAASAAPCRRRPHRPHRGARAPRSVRPASAR